MKAPKFVQEMYPKSAHRWTEWLEFRKLATAALATFESALTFFHATTGATSSGHSCGLHSNSSHHYKRPFPWMDLCYSSHDYSEPSISLSVETHDSDIKTIACTP